MTDRESDFTAVLGGGGWGTALALLLDGNGRAVRVWEYDGAQCERVNAEGENKKFLPGVAIPRSVTYSNDFGWVVDGVKFVVFVVPSRHFRATARAAVACGISQETRLVVATKGLEPKSMLRMSQVLEEEVGAAGAGPPCVLAGPSHAEEVSRGVPTAVVSASLSEDMAREVQDLFMAETFRVYTNADVVGVELGVSVKNVIAVAAGICDGLGYGDNTKGALLTRGLAEMVRLGAAMGARPETFFGLAGVGDLVTTCLSRHSRNRFVGEQIGKGRRLPDILRDMVMVAEGVDTARAALELAGRCEVEMPITEQVNAVLFDGKDPSAAIRELMSRERKAEVL
jgi:glycerol-3-phosphate dehydrogenase (NAD(P)+)